MPLRLLRLALVFEFLVAIVSIFTAWSEIGGQSTLDSMAWFWKLGLSSLLASAVVGYSSAITLEENLWTLRSARWLAGAVLIIVAMGFVTYYFQVQADTADGDESSTISAAFASLWFFLSPS